ncbi:hypothetical protein [Thiomicrorhabdus chilensis]|uniref:hypothetical protein n=1 Tax=Thiomicrorhabdus chilensis TaxID=63656 RepID=UPI000415607E|nr:hypothetical protein [Thiomicrorhabdus chilensis]
MEKPIFIDFEASAINGFPIEIAYGTSEEDLKCFLIKPLPVWNDADYLWDYNAQDMHGFSKNYINQYGINAETVARELSSDLKGKTVYADNGADLNWLLMLLDDVSEMTGETYPEPKFKLIHTLIHEQKIPNEIAYKAQIVASEKFREKGLTAHKADADTLKHIWTWEAVQELMKGL